MFTQQLVRRSQDFPSRLFKPKFQIPVRYPYQTEIVRTAPAKNSWDGGWFTVADPGTDEVYVLFPDAWRMTNSEFLETHCISIGFALTMSSAGSHFLWPYLYNYGGSRRAKLAVKEARNRWVRVIFDESSGDYLVDTQMYLPSLKPRWPKLTEDDVIDIAFADRAICSLDHPVMKKLWVDVEA